MQFDDHDSDDNLRREKLLELERRQQALQRLCEEALKEDEVEKDLPPYLSPPSSGGAYGATQFSRLPPPPRDVVTDDLLTGEVQSFRDPNSLGRASSMNSASRAPSAPQGGFMPPRRSASREYTGLSRPFVPRSTLHTQRGAQDSLRETAGGRRAWSAHAGINKTPMREKSLHTPSNEDAPAHRQTSTYRNRYFGVVDTPVNSTSSPHKTPYASGPRRYTPPPPPPPTAELLPPERGASSPATEKKYKTRAPPPPPRADRALYEPLDPPPPPPRPSSKRPRAQQAIPPPPPAAEDTVRHAGTSRTRRHKPPTLTSPSAHASVRANNKTTRATPLEVPLTLSEAYSRYAPPSTYRNGGVKHFFQPDPLSSAASVAESSSFTSYFSSVSKVEQWRSQLQSNDDALGAQRHRIASSSTTKPKKKGIASPPPPPPPQVTPPPPPSPPTFSSDSETVGDHMSVWENESVTPQSHGKKDELAAHSIFSVESHDFPDETQSIFSEPVSVPPLPARAEPAKKVVAVPLHPYATNAPPPIEVYQVEPVSFEKLSVNAQAPPDTASPPVSEAHIPGPSATPKSTQDFFDESPAKAALRHLLVDEKSGLHAAQEPPAAASTGQKRSIEPTSAPHKESSPPPYANSEQDVTPAPAPADEADHALQEKLRDAQAKTEALARHLVKAINEKSMLAENVKQLEELVEESTFEVGRLHRVVMEQQTEQNSSVEMRAMLRAKEREIAVYEDEVQRLNSVVDRHLLRVASKEDVEATSAARMEEVDAAMTEVGAAYVAQREAEERAAQLSGELEAAVEQIQALDERLAEMERGQAANRLSAIRDAVAVNENADAASPSPHPATTKYTEHWPEEARRMIAQLTAHAEGLLVQNSESARHASAVLRHADYSREELQQKLQGRSDEVELLQGQCVRLQREKSVLLDASEKMRHQLKSVKEDAQLVSELVRTSRNEAEQVMESCNSPPARGQVSPVAAEGGARNGQVVVVKDFAQQVMRDFRAVSRFLAALREMDIEHDNGYEILVKLADGASPADTLYHPAIHGHTSAVPVATRTAAQQRLQTRRDFVVRAVQQALVGVDSPSASGAQNATPPRPWARATSTDHPEFDEITEADAFVAEKEVEVVSRIRLASHNTEVDADESSSIYRDDTGMVLSDVRRLTPRRGSESAPRADGDSRSGLVAPPSFAVYDGKRGDRKETTRPGSPEDPAQKTTTFPSARVPFSVIEETPPSVSRPLRLSSGTPADVPDEALVTHRQKDARHSVSEEQHASVHDSFRPSCNSSGILSVSDIPFDNAEAEKNRQQRGREGAVVADAASAVTAEESSHTPSGKPLVQEEEEEDVSPVIRPPSRLGEHHSGEAHNNDDDGGDHVTALPQNPAHDLSKRPVERDAVSDDDIEAVDLLGDDFVLPSEQQEDRTANHQSSVAAVGAREQGSKNPVPTPRSLPPLAPSPQVSPSQSPVPFASSGTSAPAAVPAEEKTRVPPSSRTRVDDDDDDEDNEPSLFFYPESDSRGRARGPTDGTAATAVTPQQPPQQPPQEPVLQAVATTDHSSVTSSVDRESGSHTFHHRAPPSAGLSVGGSAPLPRLQRSTTTSPQTVALVPSAADTPAGPVLVRATPDVPHADTPTQALAEPHKASPSKPTAPRQAARQPDTGLTPEELSGVEDTMGSDSAQPPSPLPVPVDSAAPAESAEEPIRRSGTARPSSASHRRTHLSSSDDGEADADARVTASPSPKAARAPLDSPDRGTDGATRQRSTTVPGEAASPAPALGLPAAPAHDVPAVLAADMPLPAAPLSAPSKPASSAAASRPRAAVLTATENIAASLAVPRVYQDPPETRLSLARAKPVAARGPSAAVAPVVGTPHKNSPPAPAVAASPTGTTPTEASPDKTDSPRQKRKEEVARILERIRLKKAEDTARKEAAEAKQQTA